MLQPGVAQIFVPQAMTLRYMEAYDKTPGPNPDPKSVYRAGASRSGSGEGKMVLSRRKAAGRTGRGQSGGDGGAGAGSGDVADRKAEKPRSSTNANVGKSGSRAEKRNDKSKAVPETKAQPNRAKPDRRPAKKSARDDDGADGKKGKRNRKRGSEAIAQAAPNREDAPVSLGKRYGPSRPALSDLERPTDIIPAQRTGKNKVAKQRLISYFARQRGPNQ